MFDKPTPFWADAFVGTRGMIIPKHLFADYTGAKSRDAPTNLKPVGTGPYKFVDFKPGDMVRGEINPNYHMPNRPHFDTIEMKGGGDASRPRAPCCRPANTTSPGTCRSRTRSCCGWRRAARARPLITAGGNIEHIQLNITDPWTEVDGERSSVKTKHPTAHRPAVRQALGLLVDRKSVEEHIYGRTGVATGNFLNNPERFARRTRSGSSTSTRRTRCSKTAGWKKGADGIRAKDGKKLKFVFQTSINTPRQKTQAIVKQACQKAGIDLELKSVTASVFFSSDVANPDTYTKFYCDIQMYTTTMTQPDPGDVHEPVHRRGRSPTKENKWQGRNITRWSNAEYDKAFTRRRGRARSGQARGAVHPDERSGLRRPCGDPGGLPADACRRSPASCTADISGWDNNIWATCKDWYPRGVSRSAPARSCRTG